LSHTQKYTNIHHVTVLGYNRRQLHTLSEYAGGTALLSNSYNSFSRCDCFTTSSFAIRCNTSK